MFKLRGLEVSSGAPCAVSDIFKPNVKQERLCHDGSPHTVNSGPSEILGDNALMGDKSPGYPYGVHLHNPGTQHKF